ncbi:MAG: beta-N-acetylhexosaminidase [Elusimicrobia bacterium]|nr:beta-N-acetylhexosaminidase [Elusimicrobiota bacterium]
MSKHEKPGFLFMFGVYGTRATRESVALLKETGACGVLLLGRNIESPKQLRRLVGDLQDKVGRPLLFSIDHEGGWVLRFERGVTAFPGNACLGRVADPNYAYAVGRQMGFELKDLGIQINLAPVLDVLADTYNPGIGIRSFGKDPALVSTLGAAMIRGMQDHGTSACAKHFPGKGAATQDAHVTLPTIRTPAAAFKKRDLAPFRAAVKAGVHCVMTSHVRFPALDPSGATATFSSKITGGLLRRDMKFRGVLISDDLCMGAVTEEMPIQQAAIQTLESGHDILLIAHEEQTQREAWELLESAVADGLVPRARIDESARRIRALMALHRRSDSPEGPGNGAELARHIARRSVELIQPGAVGLPLPIGNGNGRPRVAVLFPDFAEVKDRFTQEGGVGGPLDRLRRNLARWPARADVVLTPIQSSPAKAAAAAARAKRADLAVLFCFEAMRFAGQKETLLKVQAAAARKTAVCLIRNPWDRSLLKREVTALDGFGYRDCTIASLLDALYPAGAPHA